MPHPARTRRARPIHRTPRGKPKVLLLSDVRGWAFDVNNRDMAEYLGDEFHFDFFYVEDFFSAAGLKPPGPETYDLVCVPYHRWPSAFMEHIPLSKAVGSLRSQWFWTEAPRPAGPRARSLVNRHRKFYVVTERNYEELRSHCPGVMYLTNPVNMRRVGPPTNILHEVVASWNGNAKHHAPLLPHEDPKGFYSIAQPAVEQAGVPLVFAEYNTNRLPMHKMPDFYRRANLALCTSLFEGASNSVLEAMAAGQAVIATRSGNMAELDASMRRHFGESGILLVDRTVEAFVAGINSLKNDMARVFRMGQVNRREIIARWSWDEWAPRYSELLRGALGQDTLSPMPRRPARTRRAPRTSRPQQHTSAPAAVLDVCSLSCGESTHPRSLEALRKSKNQSYRLFEVKNVSPMYAAFNAMLDAAESAYVVQLDSDMMLYPGTIDLMYERIRHYRDSRWHLLYFLVRDVFRGRDMQAIKVFNLNVIGGNRFREIRGTDREFNRRMEEAGCGAIQGWPVPVADHVMEGPATLYAHFHDIYRKDLQARGRKDLDSAARREIENLSTRLKSTGNTDYWFAILGLLAGYTDHALRTDKEKSYLDVVNSPALDVVAQFPTVAEVLRVAGDPQRIPPHFDSLVSSQCPSVAEMITRIAGLPC